MQFDAQTRLVLPEAAKTIPLSLEAAEALVMAGLVRYTRSGRLVFVAPGELRAAYLASNNQPEPRQRR